MSLPELALRDAGVTFGGRPLFSGVDVAVGRGERLCLVGRNGSGKSTLLKALAGLIEIDQGARFLQPGRRVAYMAQEPVASAALTVADYVAAGAGAVAPIQPAEAHRVQALLAEIGLAGDRPLATLSGGEERRAALARALAGEPDILLLDEPTNHLDLPTVEWLERRLADFPGGVLLISHDRAFPTSLTKVTLWLHRGRLRRMNARKRSGGMTSSAVSQSREATTTSHAGPSANPARPSAIFMAPSRTPTPAGEKIAMNPSRYEPAKTAM